VNDDVRLSFSPWRRRWAEGSDEGDISRKKLETKFLACMIPPHPPFRDLLTSGEKETPCNSTPHASSVSPFDKLRGRGGGDWDN